MTATSGHNENYGSVSTGTRSALSGVWGNLSQGYFGVDTFASTFTTTPPVNVYVSVTSGYFLTLGAEGWAVYPATGSGGGTCSHSGTGSWGAPLTHPPGTALTDYACFINKISNTMGASFGSWDDKAVITYPSGIPYLTCHGDSEAEAVCVPITSYLGAVEAGSSSSSTSSNLGSVDWTNNKICLLYAINGYFRTNSTSDKVHTYYSGSTWYLATSAGKGAGVACVY